MPGVTHHESTLLILINIQEYKYVIDYSGYIYIFFAFKRKFCVQWNVYYATVYVSCSLKVIS